MKTVIQESDPFAARPLGTLASIDTDYRFQKGDEIFIEGERRLKVRILDVRVTIANGQLSREILALKL